MTAAIPIVDDWPGFGRDVIGSLRVERHHARSQLWASSTIERVRRCGRVPTGGGVAVRVTEGPGGRSAGLGGLTTCGSVWACPVCSAKVAQARSHEIGAMLDVHRARGGRVVMVTLTVRHSAGDRLAALWDAVSAGWRAASHGKAWDAEQRVLGVLMPSRGGQRHRIPVIRVVETTHGVNGWHVHVHALLLVDGAATQEDARHLGVAMWGRWDRAVRRAGLSGGDIAAMDAHLVTGSGDGLGQYFSKAVYEVTGSANKLGGCSRTPFEILASLMRHHSGEAVLGAAELARDHALWAEWEAASSGRRQISLSHGLREFLAVESAGTDEEIAAESLDGRTVYLLDADEWRWITWNGLVVQVIAAWEESDESGRVMMQQLERLRSAGVGRPPAAGTHAGA